ncbi:hypothetical protein IFM89_007917 [Coptis chinensis]|uniref:Uncharacterized protein n=1 Tax=Coptis chinensis TaxID=261450 RepID=A0A835IKT0_9MAGN|nr:hypothetical protein IFM89_007917 [Coptis chinensis]
MGKEVGGIGSSGGRRQRRGEDMMHPLKVSLEELYNGTSKKLSLSRNVIYCKCKDESMTSYVARKELYSLLFFDILALVGCIL